MRASPGVVLAVALVAQVPPARPGVPTPSPTTQSLAVTTGTGRITGRVTAAESGAPLRGAQVALTAPQNPTRYVLSDDQGRYEFVELPAARYTATASKGGYVRQPFGQQRAGDAARPIQLGDGQTIERVDFTLQLGGVIAVTVVDDFGEAIAGIQVSAEQFRFIRGERQLVLQGAGSLGFGGTDDRGEYRVHGLAPGEYYVRASAGLGGTFGPDRNRVTFSSTYYPQAFSAEEAQRVSVSTGQEVGITIQLIATKTATVRGRILQSNGIPAGQVALTLTQRRGTGTSGRTISVRPDGSFEAVGVIPGDYTFMARPPGSMAVAPNSNVEFALMPVTIGGDVSDLIITMTRGGTLRGRLVFDTGAPPPGVTSGTISLTPTLTELSFPGLPIAGTTWSDDWRFEMTSVSGPRLIRVTAGDRSWFLKSIMLRGRDVTDLPLDPGDGTIDGIEVLVTQQRTTVTGSVVDSRGAPVPSYVAVIFAAERELWGPRTRFTAAGRPDQNGQFQVMGLPPGDYLAVAVPALESGAEQDPEVLERLAGFATRLNLTDGAARTISLRLSAF